MAGANVKGRGIVGPDAPVLAMANRFSRYKPEEEKAVRKVEVVEDETLKRLKEAWKSCGVIKLEDYNKLHETVKKLRHSAKDVERFSLALAEFQGEERFPESAGLFLSALINSCRSRKFVIHTHHLAKPVHHLGFGNTKSIAVKGDAGAAVGFYMQNGTITVEGDAGGWTGSCMAGGSIVVKWNAGDFCGDRMAGGTIIVLGNVGAKSGHKMEGGSISVKGNAGEIVGDHMINGSVTVGGNAGYFVGDWMVGGEIHLNGGYGSIARMSTPRKIYRKGKLIVDK
ncbi:hypothetical protein H0O00_03235 [Candidatus Micrarchaeota archaeon]|nr:hypothetical protein [Candidatus Micrarchaeota archaeon]